MAAFPSTGTLLFAGFAPGVRESVRRTEMEQGPPKQSPIDSRLLHTRDVVYRFGSLADYQAFLTWWRDTIARTGWFDWNDPVSGVSVSARIAGGAIDPQPRRSDLGIWHVGMRLEFWG